MIETGQQLVDQYAEAFKAIGGEPEACEGVIWARAATERAPKVTAPEMIQEIGRKIDEGTADHGWLLGVLGLLWSNLSEDQRLAIIAILIKGGAHKSLINKRAFPVAFTEREKAALAEAFRKGKAVAALRRLDG
jgi:hypothetical protein